MMQNIAAILLTLASILPTSVAQWNGAPFSWNITCLDPGTIEKDTFSNEVTLSIPYNVSDQFTNFTVFEKDCLTPADHIIPTRNVEVFPEANGFRKYDLDLEMNQTLIESDDNIWYPYYNVNGTVHFCVRASLWLTDDNNVTVSEVYFLETNYTVFVDKTERFNLTGVDSVTVVRTNATDKAGPEIDYDADLTAYQCDENNNYAKVANPPALVQGDFLLMCVESETVIEIEEILELTLSQPASTDVNGKFHPTFEFDAIDDGTKNNYLVDTGCTPEGPSRMCWIKIQLIANFFANPDPVDITADGTVTLNVAGSPGARRVLNIRGGSRELGGAAEGHISMSAGLSSASLNAEEDEEASSASSTSGIGAVAAAIIGGAAFAIV